jgi:hypothetical protein
MKRVLNSSNTVLFCLAVFFVLSLYEEEKTGIISFFLSTVLWVKEIFQGQPSWRLTPFCGFALIIGMILPKVPRYLTLRVKTPTYIASIFGGIFGVIGGLLIGVIGGEIIDHSTGETASIITMIVAVFFTTGLALTVGSCAAGMSGGYQCASHNVSEKEVTVVEIMTMNLSLISITAGYIIATGNSSIVFLSIGVGVIIRSLYEGIYWSIATIGRYFKWSIATIGRYFKTI